jgi:hypothetical protein
MKVTKIIQDTHGMYKCIDNIAGEILINGNIEAIISERLRRLTFYYLVYLLVNNL